MQEIASHGCFSLGMIARFEPVLHEKGEWMYPRLFWETGVLGQQLYLESHAVGISATGIGCYFDDAGKLSSHWRLVCCWLTMDAFSLSTIELRILININILMAICHNKTAMLFKTQRNKSQCSVEQIPMFSSLNTLQSCVSFH